MTSHDTPTPEALQITVPHFSLQALTHLIAAITPLLPPAPKRGPKGMAITTRVRLALSYLREGVSIRGLARISGIPVTTLRDNIGPILEAFDRLAPLLPDGTIIGDFDDIAWWCAETGGTIIVDGTELAIARPTGQVEQRPYYSGKKKTHTLKTIAVCDAESNLLWVTPLLGGATHDLTALRDANFPSQRADSGLDVLADSGFQGLQHDVEALELPTRRPQDNSRLTFAPNDTTPVPIAFQGNQRLQSEDLLAFEVGYRLNAFDRLTFDVTGFYNRYDHVRGTQTISFAPPTGTLANNLDVTTLGIEVASDVQVHDQWRLRGAYSYINMDVDGPINVALNTTGRGTPHHQGSLRSLLTLPSHVEFDSWVRLVDNLSASSIPGYVELDLRLGWKPWPNLDLSVVGQNLLDRHHPEAPSSPFLATQPTEVQRSVFGKVTWQY